MIERLYRCVRKMAIQIGRDWESCGKRACKRSRRCRGVACDAPDETRNE